MILSCKILEGRNWSCVIHMMLDVSRRQCSLLISSVFVEFCWRGALTLFLLFGQFEDITQESPAQDPLLSTFFVECLRFPFVPENTAGKPASCVIAGLRRLSREASQRSLPKRRLNVSMIGTTV